MDQAGNACVNQPVGWINEIWNRVEPYYEILKKTFIIVLTVFNICCISLSISVFMFGSIYFYHMPTIQHSFPLHFHFNRSCVQQHRIIENGLRWDRHLSSTYTKACFPVAHVGISYPTNTMLLQEGQSYSVLVKLELPETPENLNMGMFMVRMEANGVSSNSAQGGEYQWKKRRGSEIEQPITHSASKPMIMRYKSPMLRYGFTLLFWPLLMFDFVQESQVLDEMLFENLMLEQKSFNWTASIYLENPGIDIYSAHLDIVAQFSGIQYLLYRWPVVSFVFGTLSFFIPTFFICAVLFYYAIWRTFFGAMGGGANRNRPQRRRNPPPEEIPVVEDIPVVLEDAGNQPQAELNPAPEPIIHPEPASRISSAFHQSAISVRPETSSSQPPPITTVTQESRSSSGESQPPSGESQPPSGESQPPSGERLPPSGEISSRSSVDNPFTPPVSLGMSEDSFTTPSVRSHSRSSSSSSSIEMISPPSTFSTLDDDDLYTPEPHPSTSNDNDDVTEEVNSNSGEALDQSVRRRFVE